MFGQLALSQTVCSREVRKLIGELRTPTLVVQEGGYKIRSLGANARHFFLGLWTGATASASTSR
jgi:acetoin utilization deacetylase AcuC-like enzyme